MLKIKVVELATGYWQASFDGEEASAIIDRSPDQALAGLVRANLRRLGIEEIAYASAVPPEGSGLPRDVPSGQGETVFPPPNARNRERVEGG